MSTLQCPRCQQTVNPEDRFCRACGAKLLQPSADSASSGAAKPNQAPQPANIPPASAAPSVGGLVWRKHVDAWNGFTLERPSGWDVRTTHDTITVCYDLQGLTNATIRPIQLQQNATADELSNRLVEMMRSNSTNFTAWRMNPGEKTYAAMHRKADQVLLRFRCTEDNQELIGVLSVMVEGNKALVSGFQAPVSVIEKMKPTFQHILASFEAIPRESRTRFVEQSERAFAAMIPEQWQATGQVMRSSDAGVIFKFKATDPEGKLSAEIPGRYYFYQEEAKGWLGKLVIPQKYPTRSFMAPVMFLKQVYAPEMSQRYPDLRVERIANRPDLAASLVANALQMGEWVQPKNLMAGSLQCTYTENGVLYRERMNIAVQRWPLTRVWRVAVVGVMRAPQEQFAQYQATLEGSAESVRPEMEWVQLQRQKAQQAAQQAAQQVVGVLKAMQGQQAQLQQLEIMRKSNQQIFDMQQAGMQHRMALQDQQFQAFDQVIRGYQDMRNPFSGSQYEVPIGYNNYWMNGLGQVVGSNSPDSPGLNFQRMDPW